MATRNLTKRFVELRSGSKVNRHLKAGDDSSDETLPHRGLLNVTLALHVNNADKKYVNCCVVFH